MTGIILIRKLRDAAPRGMTAFGRVLLAMAIPGLAAAMFLSWSSVAAAQVTAPSPRYTLEAFDENGNAVVAEMYYRTPSMDILAAISNGRWGLVFFGEADYWFGADTFDSQFIGFPRDPNCGDETGPPPDPGPGSFDRFVVHNNNAYGIGGQWGMDVCWSYSQNPIDNFNAGRQIITNIFGGSAFDAAGNWFVFDHIEEPLVTIYNDCTPDFFVQGRQITAITAGSQSALDYAEPEPCDFRMTVKAVYRQVIAGADNDEDRIPDADDNCPDISNQRQRDADQDGVGDLCDTAYVFDSDLDGLLDGADNCRWRPNSNQSNIDGDNWGDACDADKDGDGFINEPALTTEFLQSTWGLSDQVDNCPLISNPDQADSDGDGIGDVCEPPPCSGCGCPAG